MTGESEPYLQGVRQHYMHGLCFESLWDYQTRSRTGRKSWARLDLGAEAYPWAVEDDPEGAGWCVRCCASVLGQRPVRLTHMHQSPIPTGDPASVVAALQALLPKFDIHVREGHDPAMAQDVADTIDSGGGVLARLERRHARRQIPACWVWVVGTEARPVSLCLPGEQTLSLLLVGRELVPAWACGYGARAVLTDEERWMVRSVDGQAWSGVFSAFISMVPR